MESNTEKSYTSTDSVAKAAFDALNLKQDMTLETMKVMMECASLFDKKQHDYGSKNISGLSLIHI